MTKTSKNTTIKRRGSSLPKTTDTPPQAAHLLRTTRRARFSPPQRRYHPSYINPSGPPPPPRGEGWGGGQHPPNRRHPPSPNPSPRGGGEAPNNPMWFHPHHRAAPEPRGGCKAPAPWGVRRIRQRSSGPMPRRTPEAQAQGREFGRCPVKETGRFQFCGSKRAARAIHKSIIQMLNTTHIEVVRFTPLSRFAAT